MTTWTSDEELAEQFPGIGRQPVPSGGSAESG